MYNENKVRPDDSFATPWMDRWIDGWMGHLHENPYLNTLNTIPVISQPLLFLISLMCIFIVLNYI